MLNLTEGHQRRRLPFLLLLSGATEVTVLVIATPTRAPDLAGGSAGGCGGDLHHVSPAA